MSSNRDSCLPVTPTSEHETRQRPARSALTNQTKVQMSQWSETLSLALAGQREAVATEV